MAQQIAQPVSDFDRALAEFQTMLVDLNGDGRPDAVVLNTDRPPQSDQYRVPNNPAAPDPNADWWRGLQGPGFDLVPPREPPTAPPPEPGNAIAGRNALVRVARGGPVMNDANLGTMIPPMPVRKPNTLMPRGAPPAPQQNALMRGPEAAGPSNPNVRIPFSDMGETIPGQIPGQVAPAPNALARYGQRVVSDVAEDPWGAALGLLEFAGGAGATVAGEAAATNALMRGAPGATRRTLRDVTSEGRRRNRADDYRLEVRHHNDALDWADLPSHTLQPRDAATGRFGKLPADIAKMRAQGREITRLQRDFVKRYEKKYGEKPKYDEEGQLIPPKGWFDNAP